MIYCTNKIYGKVWKIKKEEKYLDLQMTTSEKNQDGTYINSGWFPRVIGHAFNSLKDTLKEGDRISITKSKFTNERYQAKDGTTKSAFKFLILEAEIESASGSTAPATTHNDTAAEAPETTATQDACPW
jgi:hypothetical protein